MFSYKNTNKAYTAHIGSILKKKYLLCKAKTKNLMNEWKIWVILLTFETVFPQSIKNCVLLKFFKSLKIKAINFFFTP